MALFQKDILDSLSLQHFGKVADSIIPLPASGSNRRYFRMAFGSQSVIGAVGEDVDENRAFFYLTNHFQSKGLPVPQLLAVSSDSLSYLQEDIGRDDLFTYITNSAIAEEEREAKMREALSLLVKFQVEGAKGLDFSKCYPQEALDATTVMWDLNYFKYCFLKPSGINFNEQLLEKEFVSLAQALTVGNQPYFLYRDFQSRNVMMRQNGDLVFIDYQGGRRGPLLYDPASFIYQAKAGLSSAMRHRLFEHYMDALGAIFPIDKAENRTQLKLFVLFRTLQVLGAYGYRGFFEKKPHFIQSVPFALSNLKQLLLEGTLNGTYLAEVLTSLVGCEIGNEHLEPFEGLTVDVWSFSYRKGIPEDYSGNGGGFVFDCRAVHNPGRLPHLASLTGRDTEVIHYLDESKEMEKFLLNAKEIVDASVSRYVSRGFKNLMVSFGCTGGQHRSVYSAEHMTFHLKQKFPTVRVILRHREIGVTEK